MFICQYAVGQKTIKFSYLVNGYSIADKKKPFIGMDLEFSTIRKYSHDNEFKESRLFTGSNDDYIFYKIINQVWYYRRNGKWVLFYDYKNKKGGVIELFKKTYVILFKKQIKIQNQRLHIISLKVGNGLSNHNPEYFFNPVDGVVLIRTPSGILLDRKDYLKKPLSYTESTKF